MIPFFSVFIVFTLIPLATTFYYSFFEMYRDGLRQIGPTFVGFGNYIKLFSVDLPRYLGNTLIIWLIGFIPQLTVSLLLAIWFSSQRLNIKAQGFFKSVIYLPNLIMATAFSMLFFALFSDIGPVNSILTDIGVIASPYRFFSNVWSMRGLIALVNFLMWYGNTTILLLAGILGIDVSLFEAANIDGASSFQMFRKITFPLVKPIMLYVLITSLIGGLQMFDVPQILTNGNGNPDRTSLTIIMLLNRNLFSKNYGMGGAISVVLFIITACLSVFIFKTMTGNTTGNIGRKDDVKVVVETRKWRRKIDENC